MKFQLPKGTFDLLPSQVEEPWQLIDLWQWVESVCRETAADYGYREIRTPIYESTDLFQRGVGETSDIVSKEMFTFEDRGGRSISLRPEGTASAARAFVEHNLAQAGTTHKWFYFGPMFRYERPQSGRYRQHHQFGVEAYGVGSPEQDAEVIDLLMEIYRRLGLRELKVHLNTVGDPASRQAYREALVRYLTPYESSLSPESKIRLEKNPLRILDSKDPEDKEILQGAPSILNSLSDSSKRHFQTLCQLLEEMGVPYQVDDKIVRGLDYYNQTVFEVLAQGLGAQNTIGAGGRYDGLLSQFGGPNLPSVGFATGLERVLQTICAHKLPVPRGTRPLVYFIPMGESELRKTFHLVTECRRQRIPVEIELGGKKVGPAIQNGIRLEATYACVLGSQEWESGKAKLKHLATREERHVSLEGLIDILRGLCADVDCCAVKHHPS